MNKNSRIFTAIDLEMNQPSNKIIQIGAVVGDIYTGDIIERLSIFINPKEQLDPRIIELTKIHQEDVNNGVTLEFGYNMLKNMHKANGSFCNPITWGGGDSIEILNQLKKENSNFEEWCFGRRWIDTKTIYITWRLSNQKPPTGGLSRAMANLGLSFKGQAHNALWDAENTFYTYVKLIYMMKLTSIKSK